MTNRSQKCGQRTAICHFSLVICQISLCGLCVSADLCSSAFIGGFISLRRPMSHLLIVDDDPNTLASLARAFRLAGHEATVCDNAMRALELVRTQSFDIIFSDVVMPDKDGLSFLEDFKAL